MQVFSQSVKNKMLEGFYCNVCLLTPTRRNTFRLTVLTERAVCPWQCSLLKRHSKPEKNTHVDFAFLYSVVFVCTECYIGDDVTASSPMGRLLRESSGATGGLIQDSWSTHCECQISPR